MTEIEQVIEEEAKFEPIPSPTPEEPAPAQPPVPPVGPASGPEAVPRLIPGVRVVKGPDWKWGDQVRYAYTCMVGVHIHVTWCIPW